MVLTCAMDVHAHHLNSVLQSVLEQHAEAAPLLGAPPTTVPTVEGLLKAFTDVKGSLDKTSKQWAAVRLVVNVHQREHHNLNDQRQFSLCSGASR
eukprot:SAG11_NODE_428_length_9551_cov_6.526978_3_plen_95_part_00